MSEDQFLNHLLVSLLILRRRVDRAVRDMRQTSERSRQMVASSRDLLARTRAQLPAAGSRNHPNRW